MSTFLNRANEIARLSSPESQPSLISIYGEAGIGKTSLLQEAGRRFLERFNLGLLLFMDLANVAEVDSAVRPDHLVQTLLEAIGGRLGQLPPYGEGTDKVLVWITAKLIDLSNEIPIMLMFDTTEKLQGDAAFWHWLESELVSPLAVQGRIRQVFAGRIPIPWRRFEVRRIVVLMPLAPLPTVGVGQEGEYTGDKGAAEAQVREVLFESNPGLKQTKKETIDLLIVLILDLSFGHPLLSKELSEYAACHWQETMSLDELRRALSSGVVKEFIDHRLFEGIDYPWDRILWWISILDWFDAMLLQRYLLITDRDLVEGKPDYFFIQGISSLRQHHTVMWRVEQGDQLQGTIADIVRRCMQVSWPERYRAGCRAASETFAQLALEFEEGSSERTQYNREAEAYRRRLEEEESQ